MVEKKTIRKEICLKCLHEWYPRNVGRPYECPNCKSARWDMVPNKKTELVEGC